MTTTTLRPVIRARGYITAVDGTRRPIELTLIPEAPTTPEEPTTAQEGASQENSNGPDSHHRDG